jgi:hypothetical protein
MSEQSMCAINSPPPAGGKRHDVHGTLVCCLAVLELRTTMVWGEG